MILNHLKADNGICDGINDGLALRQTGGRTFRAHFETDISTGFDRLHDDRAVVAARLQQAQNPKRDRVLTSA